MGWKDLIQSGDETVVLPWSGGGHLRRGDRAWALGRRPPAPGWHVFKTDGRKAAWLRASDPDPGSLGWTVTGYLVGDRLVRDDARVDPSPAAIARGSEPVLLLDDVSDRFARVSAGRTYDGGPLYYRGVEMPLGPEQDVLDAYLDRSPDVARVKGVTPALDAAFRMESFQRSEAERRRAEIERLRLAEIARLEAEARRKELLDRVGDAAGRRELARTDFREAAAAALAVGGASLLDCRAGRGRAEEMVVTFSMANRRFECTCDRATLRIIDSGICLTAHDDDEEWGGGLKGDTFFTLESLPSVIQEAIRDGKLVVYRHVG